MIFRMAICCAYLVQHVEDRLLLLVGHHNPVTFYGVDVKPRLKARGEEEEKTTVNHGIVVKGIQL